MTQRLDVKLLVERCAWAAGGVLLVGYSMVQYEFARLHESGLRQFAAALHGSGAQQQPLPAQTADPGIRPDGGDLAGVPAGVVIITQLPIDSPASLAAAAPDMTSWSTGRIAAYQAENISSAPQAVLRIPAIELEVPVYAGVTDTNLNRGAAWIETTAPLGMPGNTGLASHRDGYFRALGGIGIGDRIELQTLQRKQEYAVDDIRVVDPGEVEVLAPSGEDRLTLVTCYPFYMVGPAPKRFVVRARAARAPHVQDPS